MSDYGRKLSRLNLTNHELDWQLFTEGFEQIRQRLIHEKTSPSLRKSLDVF